MTTGLTLDSTIPQTQSMMQAADTTSTSSSASSSDSSDITGTDFLTLLVSELKNQDPTQPTDPNAYVQQLVGVNSLEQLININQDLGGTGASSSTGSGTGTGTGTGTTGTSPV